MPMNHWMQMELIEDRATTRYTCPTCERCIEVGPEGLRVIHRGDQTVNHRAGSLSGLDHSVVQSDVPAKTSLH